MKALKNYAKYYKRKLVMEEILRDLKANALRELKICDDGQAVVDDVEFHLTTKTTTSYPELVSKKIKDLREKARKDGTITTSSTESFDSSIPKSTKEKVLAQVPDYKKHFDL